MEVVVWCRTGYSSMGPLFGLCLGQNAFLTLNNINNNVCTNFTPAYKPDCFRFRYPRCNWIQQPYFYCILLRITYSYQRNQWLYWPLNGAWSAIRSAIRPPGETIYRYHLYAQHERETRQFRYRIKSRVFRWWSFIRHSVLNYGNDWPWVPR